LYIAIFVCGFSLSDANAQVIFEQVRNTEPITYYVKNPYGNRAEFTWTITGGSIVGHASPYIADGADTIQVIWDDQNRNSSNYGSLRVSEIVKWSESSNCSSEEEQINVESWVQPKARTDFPEITVCSGETITVSVYFEGMPEYRFKWKLYDTENPEIVIEDHTTEFIRCNEPLTDIIITGIDNNTPSEKIVEFRITDVRDAFADGMPGDVSLGTVMIYVQPKPLAGTLKSSHHLFQRL
jgi:hypothetical protein